MPSHVKYTQTKKWCYLPLIFRWHLTSSNIVISLILTYMSWLQPRKEGLHFILNNSGNYDFDLKFEHCEFVGFVMMWLIVSVWSMYFVLKLRRKKGTFYVNLFYNIPPFFLIFNFSSLQLNNNNGYVYSIFNCCFLWSRVYLTFNTFFNWTFPFVLNNNDKWL